MSSYAGIYVNGKEVFTYRNEVNPEVLYLFSKAEYAHLTGREALPYAASHQMPDNDQHEVDLHIFRVPAAMLRDRLNVLGFGDKLVQSTVEELVNRDLQSKTRRLPDAIYGGHEFQQYMQDEITRLEHFNYEAWRQAVRKQLEAKPDAEESDWHDKGPLGLFEDTGQRILLRVIVDQVSDDNEIVLNISDVVEGGYMDESEAGQPSTWNLGSRPPIIITEGSYDSFVLRDATEILKPHLASYIRFLDWDMGNEGSASAAVRMLKSFAAAGISNRIVALFDNDSAAYEAVMTLAGTRLPSHFAVMHYPDLDLARSYPTLGPQGNVTMNVNRLAGSIELYLGEDVLRSQDGNRTPVQWKGYLGKVRTYQGEVLNKGAAQTAFRDKVTAAKADPAVIPSQDWSGLQLILDALIERLSSLPTVGWATGP